MSHLQAEHLEKSYKRKVVDDVTIEINSGEIVGLLGPNGAGKTTSFYMILGLIENDRGKIIFDNQDITNLPIHERARLGIGYLPQEPSVFRKLTVKENILAILELQKDSTLKQRLEKLESLLSEFNIGHLRDNIALSLSGGERRRVEIARALANEPKFILLDEPFAGIDPISVVDIKQIIKYLQNRNIGILITDHNVRETLDICNRAYIVHNGKIIYSGAPEK
jgi:lipopolysaccharide export system ATP-binding protein